MLREPDRRKPEGGLRVEQIAEEDWNTVELLAKVISSVIPAKAVIQNCLKILDSGSRFACPE